MKYEPLGEYINRKVEEQRKAYQGNLPAHNQSTLRKMIERDEKENGTDYVYGQDEGEINRGNVREY